MSEKVPEEIKNDLDRAISLHQRATADYAQCEQFSKLMSDILSRLEDAGCYDTADRVMSILLDCNPKTGSHCDKSTLVGNLTTKLPKYYE